MVIDTIMIVYSSISNPNLDARPVTINRIDKDGIMLTMDIFRLLKKSSTERKISTDPMAKERN